MTLDYQSIMASRLFRFVVGPEKKEYTMHSAAVSKLSRPLDRLINGEMREAREGCVTWGEMDEQTFLRFSQYAYKGDYTSPLPVRIATDPPVPVPKNDESLAANPFGGTPRPDNTAFTGFPNKNAWNTPTPPKKSKSEEMWDTYTCRRFLGARTAGSAYTARGETHDWTEVLLCHARLVVFADYHGIAALEKLAMHKLHWTLKDTFCVCPQRTGDLVALTKYVYEETVRPGSKKYGLRDLVVEYLVCKIEVLMKSAVFKELIKEYGEFAQDLAVYMVKRLD